MDTSCLRRTPKLGVGGLLLSGLQASSASKQDSLRDAAIEALAHSSYYCQVRCTLLPPRVPRLSLMLSSLHKEGQVCSLRLALDPEIEIEAYYHLLISVLSWDAPLTRIGLNCRSW